MKKFAYAVLATLGLFAAQAQATIVSLNSTGLQTVDGQDFVFNFNGLAPTSGAGGTFIIHAQGDYQGGTSESLTWDIDGIASGGPLGGFIGNTGVGGPFDFFTEFQALGNVEFQRTYTLTAAEIGAMLADSMISISVNLAADVGLFQAPNFVEVTFVYDSGEVPEPASLALVLVGLLGLQAFKRRQA